ncbi:SMP-30/gluconolactonase/LRE family protein [Burkholderia multivorans]|uniref:SMP-30/gluconolactonase/LRE family protein n=1 Tax=Burkholderia multivorans TaxID=87883 RepID=UPI0019D1978F|nr:SMP-30/gluconolactonase/LRE family protein [Burkholderia multivorans]MBN6738839.1 SMP-30/gluconolactonase/LRE family protein [Burkholderia multivorans]MBN7130112.1 SMP-30/gluconolactonase/LRE family protein [Burkholderia multivorans]MBN8173469.1 SMP-30/gluconolactonase/LRE family protein [Burkholderia multivorans]QSL29409.1 SMP-30/gluconolactonase/LRE family protein [Burkholderia multivorans]
MKAFRCVLPAAALLGECPRWDEGRSLLWWVDILAPALQWFEPASGRTGAIAMPEHIGCFSLTEDGGFVAGMRSGIWLLGADGRPLRRLAANPEDVATSRFNDGRCDPQGRFWAGTIDEPKTGGAAHLYCYEDGALHAVDGGFLTSNGLAFSPDGRWLYHSDTPRFIVYRRPFEATTGMVGPREPWLRLVPTVDDRGRPDGAAVDSEGYYWSALFEGGRVIRVSPDGRVVAEYPLPARCPTMCAFGGDDLRTLYVTTARHGRPASELDALPLSGGVFAMDVDVPGLVEPRSDLTAAHEPNESSAGRNEC